MLHVERAMGRIRGLLGEARLERIVRIPGVEGDHVEAALRQAAALGLFTV